MRKFQRILLTALLLATTISGSAVVGLQLPEKSTVQGAADEFVKIHESPKPIECAGVRQTDLAPESKVVAVHFDNQQQSIAPPLIALNINTQNALLSEATTTKKQQQQQPGKQSQEFEISSQDNTTTQRPAVSTAAESGNNQTTGCNCENSTSSPAQTTTSPPAPSEQPSSTTTTTTTTTTTNSPPPVSEPSVVVDAPVGTKTIRQGDAVFCGEANPNGKSNKRLVLDRIVGGRKTEPGEFPFQVRLNIRSRRGSGICGGVILDRYHILTAAHCMTACASQYLTTATIESTGVHATIGDHSIKSNDGEIEIDVEKITAHEKYDACNFYANDHDIALIKTSAPIEYRFTTDGYGSINRPCMPRDPEIAYRDAESVIVSGWGVTRENSGSLSNILRYVQVPVVNTTKCQETYGSRVTKDHVCAGYQSGGKDSCQGDSGGPLVRVVDNRYELVGIVSFGYGCGQPGAPGVYTRVASYIDWIKANL